MPWVLRKPGLPHFAHLSFHKLLYTLAELDASKSKHAPATPGMKRGTALTAAFLTAAWTFGMPLSSWAIEAEELGQPEAVEPLGISADAGLSQGSQMPPRLDLIGSIPNLTAGLSTPDLKAGAASPAEISPAKAHGSVNTARTPAAEPSFIETSKAKPPTPQAAARTRKSAAEAGRIRTMPKPAGLARSLILDGQETAGTGEKPADAERLFDGAQSAEENLPAAVSAETIVSEEGEISDAEFNALHKRLLTRVQKKRDPFPKQVLRMVKEAAMPRSVQFAVLQEISSYLNYAAKSADAMDSKRYLSYVMSLPWGKSTEDRYDLAQARRILDRDHSSLEAVKKNVLEILLARERARAKPGGVILFLGPNGVGKTSVARAIAEALGRRFVRLSLSGISTEARIRGEVRTNRGARYGALLQMMNAVGVNNPVMLLDSFDKMADSENAGPLAAILEALDPEQNKSFKDDFLELPFDLSRVLFIVTANDTKGIPEFLLDRMEIIPFPGYLLEDKLAIAQSHLLAKAAAGLGLDPQKISIDLDALEHLAVSYTYELGVRQLERQITTLLRKLLMESEIEGKPLPEKITKDIVRRHLGPETYTPDEHNLDNGVGRVSSLAFIDEDAVGMAFSIDIKAIKALRKGGLRLQREMADSWKDSAELAYHYIRSKTQNLSVDPEALDKTDLVMSVYQSGPVEGPSAGAAMTTAMVSALTGRAVKPLIAMTGEIGLDGQIGAVGALPDKVIAAYRAGYKTVIFPAGNAHEIELIPEKVRQAMQLKPVKRIEEVLELALEPEAQGPAR